MLHRDKANGSSNGAMLLRHEPVARLNSPSCVNRGARSANARALVRKLRSEPSVKNLFSGHRRLDRNLALKAVGACRLKAFLANLQPQMGVVAAAVLLRNLAAAKLAAKANQTHADKAVPSAEARGKLIESHMRKAPRRQLDQVVVARGIEISTLCKFTHADQLRDGWAAVPFVDATGPIAVGVSASNS